eukprot:CAMPEP_0113716614 /NCGR_PEP_ID=MMETSP0038_2-20120614/34002_1 /TAXON_ID=2898 /ORGANISM="Cryptomonas paramecium" /LENGTH=68 /DNA_ID=CAMNT_0000644185 /DNA_START=484 /DNA_END=690 /DNA_ORIENTATION=- /assembly_acc=CAM_ASM_000170
MWSEHQVVVDGVAGGHWVDARRVASDDRSEAGAGGWVLRHGGAGAVIRLGAAAQEILEPLEALFAVGR